MSRPVAALLVAAVVLQVDGYAPAAVAASVPAPSVVRTVTVTSGVPTTPPPRRLITGWLPYWSMGSAIGSVAANAGVFTDVSPFWYDARGVSPSVYLVDETYGLPGGTAGVVRQFHSYGLRVLPTVTDGTSGWKQMAAQLSTAAGRSRMVSLLVNQISSIGADGVDLDWEQFAFSDGSASWPSTRPVWIAFVNSLAATLHERGKLLSITVPAGNATASDSTGYWVYAWSAIAPVIDRLRIMTYDYSPSTPGPIGPYPWIDAVAAYAVTQVPAAKIQIGLASYGRDWVWSSSGSCPTQAPPGSTSTQAATFFNNINWSWQTHEYDSSYAATYVATLFKSAIATTPGITLVQAPAIGWDSTYKERVFNYQVKFSGVHQPATFAVTAVGGVAHGNQVHVSSTSGISVGATITGTGIAAGTKVTAISGDVLVLSTANVADVTGTLTVTSRTATATSADAAIHAGSLVVPASPLPAVGDLISGAGLAAGATITKVTPDAGSSPATATVELSKVTTAAVPAATAVAFDHVVSPVSVGGPVGAKALLVANPSGIPIGAAVSATGIGAGAKVVSVKGNVVGLSVANTAAVRGAVSVKPAAVAASCTIARQGWYSDGTSAIARAALVDKYHLGGLAEWTIGGEDPSQWAGLRAYAQSIAAWPSVVSATGPTLLGRGVPSSVTGSVTYRGSSAAGVPVVLQARSLGSTVWRSLASGASDSSGRFTLAIPAQSIGFTWRVTALGDGWRRLGAAVAAATTVPLPASIATAAPTILTGGSAASLSATVKLNGNPVAGAPVTLAVAVGPTGAWTNVAVANASSGGTVSFPLAVRAANYRWRLTIPGDGYGRLATSASGAIAVRMLVVAAPAAPRVKVGSRPVFRGAVWPVRAGTVIWLQRWNGKAWVNETHTGITAAGRFAIAGAALPKLGARYRIVANPPSIAINVPGASATMSVLPG